MTAFSDEYCRDRFNKIGGRMLNDSSTWEQPLVIYTRARLGRKASNLSLSNKVFCQLNV